MFPFICFNDDIMNPAPEQTLIFTVKPQTIPLETSQNGKMWSQNCEQCK